MDKINGLSREQLQQLMADVHSRMEMSGNCESVQLSVDEYAAVMVALEIAGEL